MQALRPPSPPSTTTPASPAPAPADDPLLQVMAVARQPGPDAVARLAALHAASPDVRATLRLVPPAYIDALAVASEAAWLAAAGAAHDPARAASRPPAPGTRLQQQLAELTLSGSDAAAAMLAELLGNAGAAEQFSLSQVATLQSAAASTLLSRVGSNGAQLDAFAGLLCAAGAQAAARDAPGAHGRIRDLTLAVAAATAAVSIEAANGGNNAAQVLSLLAQLLAQHGAEAAEALAGYEGLRAMARHVISLLSQPAPLIVAPALHVLTRMLLRSYPETPPECQQYRELNRLAATLGCKLFDKDHIGRTLTLVADLCLDCRAAASDDGSLVAHDLRVLEEVAGTVDAMASTQRDGVQALLFESTAMAPVFGHLVAMAKLNRRYLGPLLAMTSTVLSCSGGNTALPLVATLFDNRDYGQADTAAVLQDSSAPLPSIVDELFDIVLSGIEDALDTVPRFTLPSADWLDTGLLDAPGAAKAAGRSVAAQPPWPRVSSEESGCGWLVNCGQRQRQQIHRFVRLAISATPGNAPAKQAIYWMEELVDAVAQALQGFLLSADSESPNAQLCDPLGVAWVGASSSRANANGPDAYLSALNAQQRRAGGLPLALGTYYWAIRPIVALLVDLSPLLHPVAPCWRGSTGNNGLVRIMRWAELVCNGINDGPGAMLGDALSEDMCNILAASGADPLADQHQQHQQQKPDEVPLETRASAITPSEPASPELSSVMSSPEPRDVIGVDDLRAACSGAGLAISNTGRPRPASAGELAHAAVLRHWARTCEAELAAMLVLCDATVAQDSGRIEQCRAVNSFAQRARLLMRTQQPTNQSATAPFLDKLPLAVAVRQRYTACQRPLVRRLNEQRRQLADAEHENTLLRDSSRQAQERDARQRDLNIQQQQAIQALEVDIGVWKDECEHNRIRLEQSESTGNEARQQLIRLADRHEALQVMMDTKQEAWEKKQVSLTENIRKLEIALGEALARIRELETQSAADHAIAEQLRSQASTMNAKLSEYSKISEALYNISRMPH